MPGAKQRILLLLTSLLLSSPFVTSFQLAQPTVMSTTLRRRTNQNDSSLSGRVSSSPPKSPLSTTKQIGNLRGGGTALFRGKLSQFGRFRSKISPFCLPSLGTDNTRASSPLSCLFPVTPKLSSSALILGAVNFAGFLISVFTGSHVHLDLMGTGAFIPASLLPSFSLKVLPASSITSLITLTLWATRLSLFLFYRATIMKHDSRLTKTLSSARGCFRFWFITFLWQFLSLLPYTLTMAPVSKASGKNSLSRGRFFSLLSSAGFVVSVAGLAIETIADFQKWDFKQVRVFCVCVCVCPCVCVCVCVCGAVGASESRALKV